MTGCVGSIIAFRSRTLNLDAPSFFLANQVQRLIDQFAGWFKNLDFSEHLTSENLPRCDIIRAYKSFIKNLGLG